MLKCEFKSQTEYDSLVEQHKDCFLVEVQYLLDGNFMIFASKDDLRDFVDEGRITPELFAFMTGKKY